MIFKVEQDTCVGCGACESTCPEVFEVIDDKSQVKLNPVPKEFQSPALSAEDGCPVLAISHQE